MAIVGIRTVTATLRAPFDVTFDDPDRFLAAQAVNTLVGEYVQYTTSTDVLRDTTTVADLRLQVDSTERKLTAAESALRELFYVCGGSRALGQAE